MLPQELHKKRLLHLKAWAEGAALQNQSYYMIIDAINYAVKYHDGYRKDNVTPEFFHQVSVAQYLVTLLPSIQYPAETLTVAILHDILEDYDVDHNDFINKFGVMVYDAVKKLTKVDRYFNTKKPNDQYFADIAKCPIASIVKGADRINNLNSMVGVFNDEKMKSYIDETKEILVMLKAARNTFTKQRPVYENVKLMLESGINFVNQILKNN